MQARSDAPVVLFCDDAPSIRWMIRQALQGAGYATMEATDGQHALDVLASGVPVHLLLTDLHMPDLDGLDVVRRTRALAHRRYLPIVMVTTESQPDRIRLGVEAGLTAWIVKPFDADRLLHVVSRALRGRHRSASAAAPGQAPSTSASA